MSSRASARAFLADHQISFKNEELMSTALIHPSYAQERSVLSNNQRLEFLGDAVLDFVVAEYLYQNFRDKAEGDLTQIRARVVCEKALVEMANRINIGRYLMLGRGEDMSGGRNRKSILADTVEAVIGAIYLDQGLDCTRDFILKYLEPLIVETASGDYQDYKSRLQEFVQARSKDNVYYKILNETGPAHAKSFVAGVFLKEELLATGQGRSKKEAEQNAAGKALENGIIMGLLS
ncbi:MAG: ribonuclease III [Syntrophomonadaceae bacterium]|nr:ribonuclease III [Syntrophomonadaceae bacterium]